MDIYWSLDARFLALFAKAKRMANIDEKHMRNDLNVNPGVAVHSSPLYKPNTHIYVLITTIIRFRCMEVKGEGQ